MKLKRKYLDMCATLCELREAPADMMNLKAFLKGKLLGYYYLLKKHGYRLDKHVEKEVQFYTEEEVKEYVD